MTFNEKLTKLRKSSGMSQEDLAERLNVSRQAISKWEIGDCVPDTDNILLLSNIFNVTTDYLLKEEIELPNMAVIMCEKPDKNIFASKILQFFSTFFYAAGMLVSWIIWLNECGITQNNTRHGIGVMAIMVGLLIQCIGIACYYVAKKLNSSNLKLTHVFLNVIFWMFIPIAAFYNICMDQIFAPYPYRDLEYSLWGWFYYLIAVIAVAIILLIIYKVRKKKSPQEEK